MHWFHDQSIISKCCSSLFVRGGEMLSPAESGKRCRIALGERLKSELGSFSLRSRTLSFTGKSVFVSYSDFHANISQWFYGVPKHEWEDWKHDFMAILMKESDEVNYILLDQRECVTLFKKCGQDSRGDKKINIRRPTNGGKIYIVEWEDFPLTSKCNPLQVSWS